MQPDQISSSPSFEATEGPILLPLWIGGRVTEFTLRYYEVAGERWTSLQLGDVGDGDWVPLRIESACLFGHVFRSARCDCGFQLQQALERIAAARRGLVIYGIDHDARGLGIGNHFRIYGMRQREQLDSEEIFARLGVSMDVRRYDAVGQILRQHGVQRVRLLSNNAARRAFLQEAGFEVTVESLEAPLDSHNMSTLMLEKEDLGYAFSFPTHADWLEPLQASVRDSACRSGARLVADFRDLLLEVFDDEWMVADRLWRSAEARGLLPTLRSARTVLYLTDYPRVDDLAVYHALGAERVVVPFARLPRWLKQGAEQAGVRLQDWGRRNRYTRERPQWDLIDNALPVHFYRNGNRVRGVCAKPRSGKVLKRLRVAYDRIAADGAPRLIHAVAGRVSWVEVLPGQVGDRIDRCACTVTLPSLGTVLVPREWMVTRARSTRPERVVPLPAR